MIIIKFFLTLLALIALWFFNITNSYSGEWVFLDEWKTIKQLKQNIDILDETEERLNNDLKILNTDYELKSFLKNNLTFVELGKIRVLVREYNANKTKIELDLFSDAKNWLSILEDRKLLLEEKRKFYSWLIPFIDRNHKNKYLEYIKLDAKIFQEQSVVETDIISKQEILNTKVENIESLIQEHRNFIDKNIKKVIERKLKEKIQNLSNNDAFNTLNFDSKIKVLNKTIEKIKIKLENLEKKNIDQTFWIEIELSSTILDKKIQTYNIALSKLEEFRDSIK